MPNFRENLPPLISPRTALFLDFDGTLVDLAATPDAVQLQPGVLAALTALQPLLGGALALVSGRKLSDLDAFLHPLVLAAAAEHGSVRRSAAGQLTLVEGVDLSDALQAALALSGQHPTLLVEPKTHAISLHYRQAPELEQLCITAMQSVASRSANLELLRGKSVVELKPRGTNKGTAIIDFMREAPFSGRQSVFVGDDITDESGFVAVQDMGGHGIKVGLGLSAAHHRCSGPADVSAWLQAAARQLSLAHQQAVQA